MCIRDRINISALSIPKNKPKILSKGANTLFLTLLLINWFTNVPIKRNIINNDENEDMSAKISGEIYSKKYGWISK